MTDELLDIMRARLREMKIERASEYFEGIDYELKLFRWHLGVMQQQYTDMLSDERRVTTEQQPDEFGTVNDSGLEAAEYFGRRSRYGLVVHLVSVFESGLREGCERLQEALPKNLVKFRYHELIGNARSKCKKFIEAYADNCGPPPEWNDLETLITVRHLIAHGKTRITDITKSDLNLLRKHPGIYTNCGLEFDISYDFLVSGIDLVHGALKHYADIVAQEVEKLRSPKLATPA